MAHAREQFEAYVAGAPTESDLPLAASGRNPISIVVPAAGWWGATDLAPNSGGGMNRKQWPLAHEQRVLGGAEAPA